MFRHFRATREALEGIRAVLLQLVNSNVEAQVTAARFDALKERLEDLEISRAKWEAEIEAELLKAQGKYQAANNAEGRSRTTIRAYEKLLAEVGDAGEEQLEEDEWPDLVPEGNAQGGQAEELHGLHVGVEDAKAKRLRAKFS